MRILDRYIFKSVLKLFLSCLFMFLFLYIIIDVFSNLENLLKMKGGLNTVVQYYVSYLPIIFVQVGPFAGLIATLYTFGKLNRDNEIIAMRSSGMGIFQITRTVVVFGFFISLLTFWINDRFVPYSLSINQQLKEKIENSSDKPREKESQDLDNLSMYGLRNRLFFVNRFSAATSTMEGITILEHDEHQNITKKIVANKGVYKDGGWTFYHCITYEFDLNGQMKNEPTYYEEEIMGIPESPQEFLSQRQKPDYMTIAQLEDYIWKLSKSGASGVVRNLKVDLYQRFTSPLQGIIIILIGIPFSLMMKKRATGLSSLGISIFVGFLYYVLNAVSIAMGKAGVLPPLLAASSSHIIAIAFSLYLISKLP